MVRAASPRKLPSLGPPTLSCHPLTPDRWADFAALFGTRGACGGCWCMAWRRTAAQFAAGKGGSNRRAMRRLVAAGAQPGILAYAGDEPVGWCSVAPRGQFVRLAASRILAPVDERPVWSVSCFFVRRDWQGRGLSVRLLEAAVAYARAGGARLIEGYPYAPAGRLPGAFVWTGLEGTFREAGFTEVARRSAGRPIMRREIARGRCPAGEAKRSG